MLVVKLAFALELIVHPVSLVGYLIGLVVKHSVAVHSVVLPFSIVAATVLVIKFTSSMAFSVQFVPAVTTAKLEVLVYIHRLVSKGTSGYFGIGEGGQWAY